MGTMDQARDAMSLVMSFCNEVSSDLGQRGRRYSILIDRLGYEPDTIHLADDWCKGYLFGIALRQDDWKEAMDDPELSHSFVRSLPSPGGSTWTPSTTVRITKRRSTCSRLRRRDL